jgi:hypothetical protein
LQHGLRQSLFDKGIEHGEHVLAVLGAHFGDLLDALDSYNGNLTTNDGKGLSISYNLLNLPDSIGEVAFIVERLSFT